MFSFRCWNAFAVGLSLLLASDAFVPLAPKSRKPAYLTRHFSTAEPATLPEGLLKTVSKPGEGRPVKRGDVATVKYSCYLPNETTMPFAKSDKQKVTIGDGTMIDGWEMAIKTMKDGERAVVRIEDPALGYGNDGVPPLVPPNAPIEIDIEILDISAPLDNIDFDALGFADPITPRTASSIAAAYDERQKKKALEPQKEGLEAWIEKAKNFYFFGFFEGETGQKAPWFLRPSITFPIAFAAVGAIFYLTFLLGGISERGAPSTDELDEIILSSTTALSHPSSTLLAVTLALLQDSTMF